ncbi:TPA: SEC10/PgrA surface exclusion domain-containing protein [Streptococcus agalactiae]
MSNSKTHGHGTIKKLRTGAVVSVLALTAIGGVVSADEVTSSKDANTEVVAKETKTEQPVAETVTEKQVADAKVEANQANQALTAQEGVVMGAEKAVADNESAISNLNNQVKEVEKVTPEVVDQAKTDQAKAKDTLDQATSATTSAEKSLTDATNKVEAQKGVVAEAESNAEKTASAVADAKKKVDSLSDTTDTAKLARNVTDLTAKVTEDTSNVKSAKDSLDAAKLAETNKAQAIKDQKTAITKASEGVEGASKTYSNAITDQKGTQSAEDTTKSALDTAKAGKVVTENVKVGERTAVTATGVSLNKGVAHSGLFDTNGIVVTNEYLEAIRALANGTGSVQAVKDAIKKGDGSGNSLATLAGADHAGYKFWANNMKWSFANTDSTTKLDVNNLTDDQLTDLALFYTALLNDVRFKVGSSLLTVTKESVAEAKKTVTEIFNKAFPYYKGMNGEQLAANGFWGTMSDPVNPLKGGGVDLTKIVADLASDDTTIIGQMPANYVNYDNNDGRKQTMAELKAKIFANIGSQLFGYRGLGYLGEAYGGVNGKRPENFDLALEVLGLRGSASTAGIDLGFTDTFNGMVTRAPKTYTVLGNAEGKAINNPYQTLENAKETVIPVYKAVTHTVVDEVEVAKAQANYDKAVQANQDAKSALATAEADYNTAKDVLAKAQKQLSDLESGTVDIPALEKALADAQTQLEADKSSLQTAKETLALAKASATDKAKALEVAKSELAEAEKSAEMAKGVVSKEKETLEVLTKAKDVATLALTDARTKQTTAQTDFDNASAKANDLATKLANKATVLADLNSKLTEAKAKSSVLRAELETAKEQLAKLKVTSNSKNAEYLRLATLKAEQDKAEAEAKRLQALKDKADEIRKNGGQPKEVLDGKGNVVDIIEASVKEEPTNSEVVPVTYSRVERSKRLPNTGSRESMFGLLGLSLLVGLGLGYKGKHRRR